MSVGQQTLNLAVQAKYNRLIPGIFQRIVWVFFKLLIKTFCSIDIKGLENISDLKRNVIFASNHISHLDSILIVSCLPFFSKRIPLYFVSLEKKDYKKEYGRNWKAKIYGGRFFRLIGAYPAYTGLNNYRVALRHHIEIIRQGKDVAIFPMGKICLDDHHDRVKGGVTFLAKETQTPVVPILIRGIEDFTFTDLLYKKQKIFVIFGKPIYPEDLFTGTANNNKINPYKSAASALMEKIFKLAEKYQPSLID